MITTEKLLNAGFTQSFKSGVSVYSRDGFDFIQTESAWCPCTFIGGEVKINKIYLDTMCEIERFIALTQN